MLLALGAFTLSSCGGGGSPAGRETSPGTVARGPELTITPPEASAPRAVSSIPAQTLTAGGNPRQVEIARYFQDPDNDQLTYSAESGDPGVATVGMSGATLTITPVSAGEATVTITASDGILEATQTLAATVQEPAPARPAEERTERSSTRSQTPPPQPTPTPPPQPTPQQQQRSEPETTLTGISVTVTPSSDGRGASLKVVLVPEDAKLTVLDISMNPSGRISYLALFGNARYFSFSCTNGYQGTTTITFSMQRTNVATSAQVSCR